MKVPKILAALIALFALASSAFAQGGGVIPVAASYDSVPVSAQMGALDTGKIVQDPETQEMLDEIFDEDPVVLREPEYHDGFEPVEEREEEEKEAMTPYFMLFIIVLMLIFVWPGKGFGSSEREDQ